MAVLTANGDKNTRYAACREALRCTFVDKFEGYRPQTDAEKAAGTLPANYSYIQVGRGHSDRMEHNPFPEPVPPCTPLRASAYLGIEDALLQPSGDYLPLVEYYRRKDSKTVYGKIEQELAKGDCTLIRVKSLYTTTSGTASGTASALSITNIADAVPPSVGLLTIAEDTDRTLQVFFYDSVTQISSGVWQLNLRAGQFSLFSYPTPSSISYSVTLTSIGAVPWTADEVRKLCCQDIGWDEACGKPMFEKGFFYAATEKSFIDAIHARLLPTYLCYSPCSPRKNTLKMAYRYFIIETNEAVYLRLNVGSYAYVDTPDTNGSNAGRVPVYLRNDTAPVLDFLPDDAEGRAELYTGSYRSGTGLSSGQDVVNISGFLSGYDLATACVYTNGNCTLLQCNDGKTRFKSLPYVFEITCTTHPGFCKAVGVNESGAYSISTCKYGASISGGWTAPCAGTLYLALYSDLYYDYNLSNEELSDTEISDLNPPLGFYKAMRSTNYSTYRVFPRFNGAIRVFTSNSFVDTLTTDTMIGAPADNGVLAADSVHIGLPTTSWTTMNVSGGQKICFGPVVSDEEQSESIWTADEYSSATPYICYISSSDIRYPPWNDCEVWGGEWTNVQRPSISCSQSHKAAAVFVPNNWNTLRSAQAAAAAG